MAGPLLKFGLAAGKLCSLGDGGEGSGTSFSYTPSYTTVPTSASACPPPTSACLGSSSPSAAMSRSIVASCASRIGWPIQLVFRSLIEDFERLSQEQFDSEGRRSSGGWEPLAESTIRRKGHAQPLMDTGWLRGSLVGAGRGSVREVTKDHMRLGTEVPHAGFHQHGTSQMPRRRVIELTEADRRKATKKIHRFLFS